MKFCTNCGSKLEEGAKVCEACGEAVYSFGQNENVVPDSTNSQEEVLEKKEQAEAKVEDINEKVEDSYSSKVNSQESDKEPEHVDAFVYADENHAKVDDSKVEEKANYGNAYGGSTSYQGQNFEQKQDVYQSSSQSNTTPTWNQQNQQSTNMNQGTYSYNSPNPSYYNQNQATRSSNNVMAVVSLILGILSLLVCCFLQGFTLVLSIPGIVLGFLALRKGPQGKGLAIAGIATSAVATILAIIMVVIFAIYGNAILQEITTGTSFNAY